MLVLKRQIEYDCGKSIYMSDAFFHIIEEMIMYENDCYYLTNLFGEVDEDYYKPIKESTFNGN